MWRKSVKMRKISKKIEGVDENHLLDNYFYGLCNFIVAVIAII